eukprot:CAMPEP_0174832292 /NCGR_PEP_ID=MMETSP1114-20130205/3597_1 /TAXON_ID=312471 /ORGANISM="Neobodo designis, Strain CCAP 1951/1" /LENGTH=422 /DNA_ID=CAMNT_0016066147 /DNA_START=29 /DNA_END=1293 /DNA_ORIENTATION=+
MDPTAVPPVTSPTAPLPPTLLDAAATAAASRRASQAPEPSLFELHIRAYQAARDAGKSTYEEPFTGIPLKMPRQHRPETKTDAVAAAADDDEFDDDERGGAGDLFAPSPPATTPRHRPARQAHRESPQLPTDDARARRPRSPPSGSPSNVPLSRRRRAHAAGDSTATEKDDKPVPFETLVPDEKERTKHTDGTYSLFESHVRLHQLARARGAVAYEDPFSSMPVLVDGLRKSQRAELASMKAAKPAQRKPLAFGHHFGSPLLPVSGGGGAATTAPGTSPPSASMSLPDRSSVGQSPSRVEARSLSPAGSPGGAVTALPAPKAASFDVYGANADARTDSDLGGGSTIEGETFIGSGSSRFDDDDDDFPDSDLWTTDTEDGDVEFCDGLGNTKCGFARHKPFGQDDDRAFTPPSDSRLRGPVGA